MELVEDMAEEKPDKAERRRFEAKGWFFTYPQCTLSPEEVLEGIKRVGDVDEYVVAQEEHKDGGKHIHAFIKFFKKIDWYANVYPRKWDIGNYHPHVETARSWRAVEVYCKKENHYITNINIDSARAKKGKRNKEMARLEPRTAVDEGYIGFCALPMFIKAKRAYEKLEKPPLIINRRCYWIYGPPRIGKSYLVRMVFPDLYEKAQNKWWDGYIDENEVLIDDLDAQGKCLSHHLKIWADNYRFNAEIKGDTIWPRYTKLIITSNYLPEDIFGEDKELTKAIADRFRIITMESRSEQNYIMGIMAVGSEEEVVDFGFLFGLLLFFY